MLTSGKLDYCPGGEVFTYLRRAGHFDEDTARFYVAEMVLVLEFLHEHQTIAYRDMKPENMLIDADGHLKLVDFGFAKKLMQRKLSIGLARVNGEAHVFQARLTRFAEHRSI